MKMRRSPFVAGAAAVALALSASAGAAAPWDADEALDTDTLEIDVAACPSDPEVLPDGVTVVGQGGDGNEYYVAPNGGQFEQDEFNDGAYYPNGNFTGEFDENHLVVAEMNTYFQYPNNNETYDITYHVRDGEVETARATFDDDGCIETFEWESGALDADIEFRDADDDAVSTIDTVVDETLDLSVHTANTSTALGHIASGWQLGLEVDGVDSLDDVDLAFCGGDDWENCADIGDLDNVDVRLIEDDETGTQFIQVEGAEEDLGLQTAASHGGGNDTDEQLFQATFNESGSFTGEVFVFRAGALG